MLPEGKCRYIDGQIYPDGNFYVLDTQHIKHNGSELKSALNGINTDVSNKVDKVEGKGLSTEDYTTAEKNKLDGIATGANKTTVDSALSSTSTNPVQNQVVTAAINNKPPVIANGSVTSGSMNNITENTYALYSNGVTDGPVAGVWFFCRTDVHPAGDTIQFATITNDSSAESYIRVKAGGAWGPWKKITN